MLYILPSQRNQTRICTQCIDLIAMSMNNLLMQGAEPRASSTTTPTESSISPWPPMWSKTLCRAASICAHRRRDGRYTWDVPAWCVRVTLPFTPSLMPCWLSQETTISLASQWEPSSARSTSDAAGRRPAWPTVHGLHSNDFFLVCAVAAGTGVYYASPCTYDDDTASTTHCSHRRRYPPTGHVLPAVRKGHTKANIRRRLGRQQMYHARCPRWCECL